MNQSVSFNKILRRNFSEMIHAYNSYVAWTKMWENGPRIYPSQFLGQCSHALRITMLSHLIKVLERDASLRSKSFWYIYKHRTTRINRILQENQSDISFVKRMAKKLGIIRNKTLFHLDDASIENPDRVWSDADITIKDLDIIIRLQLLIFETIYSEEISPRDPFVKYSGDDAAIIVNMVVNSKSVYQ